MKITKASQTSLTNLNIRRRGSTLYILCRLIHDNDNIDHTADSRSESGVWALHGGCLLLLTDGLTATFRGHTSLYNWMRPITLFSVQACKTTEVTGVLMDAEVSFVDTFIMH